VRQRSFVIDANRAITLWLCVKYEANYLLGGIATHVAKKALIIALTAASLLCIVDPLSRLGATDQNWLPMEREFLIASSTGLVLATVLLWARVRLALVPAVVAHLVFGSYLAWLIIGTIRSENYSGPVVLVFLVCMGLCPFLAAFAAAVWSRDFFERGRHLP